MGLFSKKKDDGISNASVSGQALLMSIRWCPSCNIEYGITPNSGKCKVCGKKLEKKAFFQERSI